MIEQIFLLIARGVNVFQRAVVRHVHAALPALNLTVNHSRVPVADQLGQIHTVQIHIAGRNARSGQKCRHQIHQPAGRFFNHATREPVRITRQHGHAGRRVEKTALAKTVVIPEQLAVIR